MESENLNGELPVLYRAAEKLHTRLRRRSSVPNVEEVVVAMFEFFAPEPTPYLTPTQEELLSVIERQYGIESIKGGMFQVSLANISGEPNKS